MNDRPIFCYGTLRPGCGNDSLWRGRAEATDDGECYVVGHALVSQGWFPYLVPAATGQVTGALIWPHRRHYQAVLADMDALEGVPVHYRRVTVPVLVEDGMWTAWTYVPADERDRLLPDVTTNADGFYDWAAQPHHRYHPTPRG